MTQHTQLVTQLYGGLVPIEEAKQLIAAQDDITATVDLSAKLEAIRKYDNQNAERRNYWAELSIWSTRRLGEQIREAQAAGVISSKGGDRKSNSHDASLNLEKLGINYSQSSRAQKLADIPEDRLRTAIDNAKEAGDEITKAGVMKAVSTHVTNNSGNVEWYTPSQYIEAARRVMGGVDLDPASSDAAQQTVKSKVYYTAADDGLKMTWKGRVWLNPPYSASDIAAFTSKLCDEFLLGNVKQAVLLTNNSTDSAWWQNAAEVASAICFHRGRIRFTDVVTGKNNSPLQGQTIMYFGPSVDRFVEVFGEYGLAFT